MLENGEIDQQMMERAIRNADRARLISSPNPWVGSVLVAPSGEIFDGSTLPVGSDHAEAICLSAATQLLGTVKGSTLYTTLEPCCHVGETSPCTEAIISAEVGRVVIGILDPDERVDGKGVEALQTGGIEVEVGVLGEDVHAQLLPYIRHRTTGRPYVVVKVAATLDGRIAAPDGSSQWITGPAAREESHRLRAYSDAVCVGAETIRIDNPKLTVRDWKPMEADGISLDPLRVVFGEVSKDALVHPCLEMKGDLEDVLDDLGDRGILQLLVEGGASTISRFHSSGLVDRYEIFFAPAFLGGDDALSMLTGDGVPTIEGLWRGEITKLSQLDEDIQVTLVPKFIDK